MKTRWEKYDAKGWTEKGAHKYGRLNEQSWWEKWGEHYDGRGSVLKWFSLTSLFYFASLKLLALRRIRARSILLTQLEH